MSDSYTDQDELFDVCDSLGRPLGLRKRRGDVHRDGDWHRSLHCWVVGQYRDGTPYIVFQRRSETKDTSPGKLDATVGGHLAAGESVEEALRESEEEIGLSLTMSDLLPLGVRQAAIDIEPGVRDYEVQFAFIHKSSLSLTAFRPNPAEVTALVEVPVPDALDLFTGKRTEISAKALCNQRCHPNEAWIAEQRIRVEHFVPQADRYFYRVCVQTELLYQGYPHVSI